MNESRGRVVLEARDLQKSFHQGPREVRVLEKVSLSLSEGESLAIVGASGAGKSTLLKAVMDLMPRASGRIEVFGQPYRKTRHRVGYVPQRESVDWDFPVDALDVVTMGLYRDVGWCLPVRKKHRRKALEALDRVGIADLGGGGGIMSRDAAAA